MVLNEQGVKETKEALIALATIGVFVVKRVKDGVDLSDLMALVDKLRDEEFQAIVQAGVDGINLVDDELKDLDLDDYLELAKFIPELVEVLKQAKENDK